MQSFKLLSILSISILFLTNCSTNEIVIDEEQIPETTDAGPFIASPMDGINVEFDNYSFNAEEGTTIIHKSGSILHFPANSMVNAAGNVVTGQVNIDYREFSDPVDFFLSGITMNYDSAGTDYMFESAAMCEVRASQNGEKLFVNADNQPEVNLVSNDQNPEHNLYFLDEETECWVNKGKDFITDSSQLDLDQLTDQKKSPTTDKVAMLKPVKPRKPSGKRPVFNLAVDPASVPELASYDNLVFEVHENDRVYKESDGDVLWENVQIESGKKQGTYFVTFSNASKKVKYLTRPVFEGKEFEKAMADFNNKIAEYDRLSKERELADIEQKKSNKIMLDQNKEIERQNEITLASDARIRQINVEIDIRNLAIGKENERISKLNIIMAEKNRVMMEKMSKNSGKPIIDGGVKMYSSLYRSFTLEGFGVWNSDNPLPLADKGATKINAKFRTKDQENLELTMVQVVYKEINGINANHDHLSDFSFPTLEVIASSSNMIWAVKDSYLYFLNYDEFDKCQITEKTKSHEFVLNKHPEPISSGEDIKEVLNMRASF